MPTDPKHKPANQEEIDLLYLFIKLGEFFKKVVLNLFKALAEVVLYLLRKWYYFIFAVALTVLSGFILSKTIEPYFVSDLELRVNVTKGQSLMSILNRLNNYAEERNYSELSNNLNLSTDIAGKIKSIESFWYYDKGDDGVLDGISSELELLSDTTITMVDSLIVIRAEVYDLEVLIELQQGLINFLHSNPLLVALNKQRLADLESTLAQVNYEIQKLDSLQKREYYTPADDLRQKEGQIVFTNEKVVRLYHYEMIALLKRKQETERDLNVYNDMVTISEGFSYPSQPDNGTIEYAKQILWYYLGLALLISLIISFRKKIWAAKP